VEIAEYILEEGFLTECHFSVFADQPMYTDKKEKLNFPHI